MNAMIRLIQSEECDLKLMSFWSNNGFKFEFKTKVFSINSETTLLLNEKQTIVK